MTNNNSNNKGSVYAFVDKRTPMANGLIWPIKLTVYIKGQQFRIGIKKYTTEEIYNKEKGKFCNSSANRLRLGGRKQIYKDVACARHFVIPFMQNYGKLLRNSI